MGMISRRWQRSTGTSKDRPERIDSMSESTGLTDVTVSFWAIVQCPRWVTVGQLTLLTTNAKPTRTAKSAFVTNMVINVLASLFDTLGVGIRSKQTSSPPTQLVHVNVNCLNATFNSSRILTPRKMFSITTTTLSGLPPVLIAKKTVPVHQAVLLQLLTNVVVVSMD